MVTLFEFLGEEEIENVITCLNYKIDKVVFLGYEKDIRKQKGTLSNFLARYCGVQEVSFNCLSNKNLPAISNEISKRIETEIKNGSDYYFDVTGGEDLILVAFGMLAKNYSAPLHYYDVRKNKLIEVDEGSARSISTDVEERKTIMNIDMWIEMKGGTVNNRFHKKYKENDYPVFIDNIGKIRNIMLKYSEVWNPFIIILNRLLMPKDGLNISVDSAEINRDIQKNTSKLNSVQYLKAILTDFNEAGIIEEYSYSNGKCEFKYCSQDIRDCLTEGGGVLELYVYFKEREYADDCKVGVLLDWDKEIHKNINLDVMNEIDVITIRNNIPTFISCKTGKMDANQTLHALYELDTVADRFGGKYARKMLATNIPISDICLSRANEMGIRIY